MQYPTLTQLETLSDHNSWDVISCRWSAHAERWRTRAKALLVARHLETVPGVESVAERRKRSVGHLLVKRGGGTVRVEVDLMERDEDRWVIAVSWGKGDTPQATYRDTPAGKPISLPALVKRVDKELRAAAQWQLKYDVQKEKEAALQAERIGLLQSLADAGLGDFSPDEGGKVYSRDALCTTWCDISQDRRVDWHYRAKPNPIQLRQLLELLASWGAPPKEV